MTEKQMVQTPTEGEIQISGTEDETSAESLTENKETDDTQSDEGDDTNTHKQDTDKGDPDKNIPFHDHPRWKQREVEWTTRFNEQESRHQEDIRKLREEFSGKGNNQAKSDIPSWFGGTPEQWQEFQKWNEGLVQKARDEALGKINESKSAEDKAVKEATDYMNSEIKAIEEDKTLNPDGKKIDANKLLKIVMDNDLVDSKGRWNYRVGYRLYASQSNSTQNANRKNIAGASISNSKGEAKTTTYKTSEDFKKDRPW